MNLEADLACRLGDHGGLKGHCPDCGDVNYRLLGWYGAVARWAKAWKITQDEASDRIVRGQIAADIAAGRLDGSVDDYV
jgi:hypothetical protein